jgi:thymidylate synthase
MIRGDSHLVLDNMRDDTPKLIQWVSEHGRPVSARGQLTRELSDMSLTLLDPIDSLPLGVGRKLNLAIAAAEALQIIAGVTDPDLMVRIQPRFGSYLDGGVMHGAYGPRLRWQLNDVQGILLNDPSSRQAVVSIWDSNYDKSLPDAPRDLPCTVFLQFLFRDNKLELHTHMRSNDVVMGVSYDFFMFTQLQLTMAKLMAVEAGPYHHHATSLHIYQRDVGILDRMHDTDVLTRPEDLPDGFGTDAENWHVIATRARFILDVATGRVVDGINVNTFTPQERWFLDKLRPYWRAPE